MQKNFHSCFYLFVLHLKPNFSYSSQVLVLSDKIRVESRVNLQLIGKISLKSDSNSSLLSEYGSID